MKPNGLILFITACTLGTILLLPLFLCGLVLSSPKNTYLLKIAISIDILGNVIGGPLFNKILQRNGYLFGSTTETISYAVAVNKKNNTLTKAGILLGNILDTIDPGHTDLKSQRALRIKTLRH